MLRAMKRFFRVRQRAFEVTCHTGLIASYVLSLARGEGGKPDEKLAKQLAYNWSRIERQRREFHSSGKVVLFRPSQKKEKRA